MIISHEHKYLFVQLPRTGSTAISRELQANYSGSPILDKHATYRDFLRVAGEEEKAYFVFSCIRNPLDDVVSIYHRYKTDHKNWYSGPGKWRSGHGRAVYHLYVKRRYAFITENDADFAAYFRRYHRLPYTNWSSLDHKRFDFIIRFEKLQEDFAQALALVGIEQKRPLPRTNVTAGRNMDFLTYYSSDLSGQAKWVFAPFMKEWGYEFPPEWEGSAPKLSWVIYRLLTFLKGLYWKHLSS